MKKLLIGAVLALALSGCASTGSVQPGKVTEVVKDVQNITRTVCRFVPTAQTIISIFNAGAAGALGVANEICAAITSVPLADGGKRKVIVRGVPVAGRRV